MRAIQSLPIETRAVPIRAAGKRDRRLHRRSLCLLRGDTVGHGGESQTVQDYRGADRDP